MQSAMASLLQHVYSMASLFFLAKQVNKNKSSHTDPKKIFGNLMVQVTKPPVFDRKPYPVAF